MRTEAEVVELIQQHTELAKRITLHYVPSAVYQLDPDEWDSLAQQGLWLAAKNWNASKSAFNTFLTWKIRSLICNQKDKNRRRLKRQWLLTENLPRVTHYTQRCEEGLVKEEQATAAAKEVEQLLAKVTLTERQRQTLELLFWKGYGPTEAAKEMGVTKQRVDSLRSNLIKKLRTAC